MSTTRGTANEANEITNAASTPASTPARARSSPDDGGRERRGLLGVIAAFKLVKTALLVLLGLGALRLVSPSTAQVAERWLSHLSSPTGRRYLEHGLDRLLDLGPGKLRALGVGAFLYAALFLVEGVGLWLEKLWAEYLTIVATASFIPVEIYELVREATRPRIVALVLNVATVVYLVFRVRRSRHAAAAAAAVGRPTRPAPVTERRDLAPER